MSVEEFLHNGMLAVLCLSPKAKSSLTWSTCLSWLCYHAMPLGVWWTPCDQEGGRNSRWASLVLKVLRVTVVPGPQLRIGNNFRMTTVAPPPPCNDMSTSKSLEPVNMTLFRKRIFADLTKLRNLRRWDYPELPGSVQNPMICILL